jgi:hypothetical protein
LWEGVDPIMTVTQLRDYLDSLIKKDLGEYEVKVATGFVEATVEESDITIREVSQEVLI